MSGYCSAHIHHDPTCRTCSFAPPTERTPMPADKSDHTLVISLTVHYRIDNVTEAQLEREVRKLTPKLKKKIEASLDRLDLSLAKFEVETVEIAPPA